MITTTAAMDLALAAMERQWGLLFEFQFSDGTDYFCTFQGSKPWDGETWVGTPAIALVGEFTRSAEQLLSPFSVLLAVGPNHPGRVSDVLTKSRRQLCRWWVAALNESTGGIVTNPIQMPTRVMHPGPVTGGSTYTVRIDLESRLNVSRARVSARASHAEQVAYQAGDFSFIDSGRLPRGNEARVNRRLRSGFGAS